SGQRSVPLVQNTFFERMPEKSFLQFAVRPYSAIDSATYCFYDVKTASMQARPKIRAGRESPQGAWRSGQCICDPVRGRAYKKALPIRDSADMSIWFCIRQGAAAGEICAMRSLPRAYQ
ncbi:hypothetical protein LJC59_09150, partial [Desulfovibrio sp. OttesenSCG-928-A18]|nr:hypothetical protein [Desulfovibrio sp. OttesenSCG-928-A18]